MGIFVNRGNASFRSARKSQIYVDKSGLLQYTNSVIDTEQRYICSSRPRRFGKTMAAGMLAAYYEKGCDSRALFADLEIGKDSLETVAYIQKCVIEELREIYPGILSEEDKMLPIALSKIHNGAGAEFVIIIDEWDAIFREDRKSVV